MTMSKRTEMTTQEPARTPLLLAGAAVMGLAALTFALKGTSYLEARALGWHMAAVAAATVALVALVSRPDARPLVFPTAWLWSLLTGPAVFDVLWPSPSSSGETISTPMGEAIVPSSHWESFGWTFLGGALLTWLIAMLVTGFGLFLYSMCMSVLAGDAALDRWHARGRRPEMSQ